MTPITSFDLERSVMYAFHQNERLKALVPLMRVGPSFCAMEVPHLWIEVTKVSVADISRLCAEGTIGLCFPLTKSTEKTQVWQEIREIFQQALPVRLGEQTVGTARLEEKELRKNLKKEGSVEVMNFEAFLRLERIYA